MSAGILIKPQIKDRIESITLLAANWAQDTSQGRSDCFVQTIVFESTTTNRTKVNLSADRTNYLTLLDGGVRSIQVINTNGVFTIHLTGTKPTDTVTLQCALIETVEGETDTEE